MSRYQKLLNRFAGKPSDFTFDELKTLLSHLGYEELKKGKTGGSRVAFFHPETKHIIRLHKPHPRPLLKHYQIDEIWDELHKKGVFSL